MNRDTVTGAYARTALMERLEEEVQRGMRYGDAFSLLVLDLDHFKSVNDAFGHSRGDTVLAELAGRVHATARGSDVLFRYGGDEFVVFLPRTSREQGTALARRLADEIARAPFAGTPPLTLTASVGVAAFPEDGGTATELFDCADARMYQAKRGADRVVAQDGPQRLAAGFERASRLVERGEPLERIHRFLQEIPRARRGVLHLAGPAGSGRSRLLRETEQFAALRGHRVLRLRGRPESRAEPLGTLRAALAEIDSEALRPGSPEAVAAHVRRAVAPERGAALVVTVDDLGDVDRATLDVLRALAAGPRRAPSVALVHTAGEGEPAPGAPDAALHESVRLDPLSREGLRVWLRAGLQAEPGEDLVDWLHTESGGLPGAAQSLLLQLTRRGSLAQRGDGTWALRADFHEIRGRATSAPLLRGLPAPASFLVDRDVEVRETLRTLRAARVVTLCGPRGAGKTRLAVEAAHEAAELFADGVAWVEAEDSADPRVLWTDIAVALGVRPGAGGDADARLVNALRSLHLLLVIDGMNDGSAASLLQRILDGAPDVRILVTARQRLGMAAEWAIPVQGLPIPRASSERVMECDAVRLFVERATKLNAAPGEADLAHVARLVNALDGMPLAVELAAAQAGDLSAREIAHEVQSALEALRAYLPAEPPERRATRAVLDVCWRLLPAHLRAALRRVSLFHGSFGEDAARRVAAAGAAELEALEQRALLRRTRDGRWRVHGLIRDYAQAKLDDFPRERADAATAYRDHHLARLRDAGSALEWTDSADDAAAALEAELPDLRRAWELAAREGPAEGLAAAADALLALLARRGAWAEAEMRFAGAAGWLAARGGAEDALRRLETRLGIARVALERPGDAAPLLRRALAAAVRGRDAAEEAVCLVALARAHLGDGEPRLARGAAASAVSAADRAGDGSLRVRALCAAAESELAEAGYREAVEALYEAVEVEPGSVAAVEAWHQLVATAAVLLRAGQLSLAAVLLSRAVSGAGAPAECVARAQTLLAELRGADQQPPSAVPALVIVSQDAPALRSAIDPAPSPPPPTRISA